MTRIALDPEELNRFAALAVEAADDYSARATRLRGTELPPMPADIAVAVNEALQRIGADVDQLATALYGEALILRTRASAVDPVVRGFILGNLPSLPG